MNQNIIVRLSAQGLTAFKAQMAQAAAATRGLHDDAAKAAGGSEAATRKAGMAMAALGVATVAAAAVSAKAAMDLEKQMQNVATIWTDASVSIQQAGQRVLEMSTELPQTASVLAEGLYDIASSGFQGAAGLQVLKASGTAAAAGLTDTATAARGITAVLNAYGLGAEQASLVSDVLFQTVNLGVVTFEELANTMGDFVGTAAVAGINIRDANTALATMTLNGISASESGTSLNRVIQALIQPGEALAAALQAMGYQSGVAALDALGLQGVMTGLAKQTGGGAEAMSGLFTEIRSLRGALALTSAGGENYIRVAEGMNDETQLVGATAAALAEQSKSASYQLQMLKSSVVAAAITFGQSLLPAIKFVVGIFQTAIDLWTAVPGPLKVIIGVAGLLAGIVVGLAGAFLLLAPGLAAASAGFGALTGMIGLATGALGTLWAALGPVGWVVAGIGVAVAGLTGLWAKHAKGQAETKRRVDELKGSLDAETGAITDQTSEILRNRVVKDDMDKKAKQLNISLETLMRAMLGEKDAIAEVNAASDTAVEALYQQYVAAVKAGGAYGGMTSEAHAAREAWQDGKDAADDLAGGIKKANGDLKDATKASQRDKEAKDAATTVTQRLTRATTAKAEADRLAAEAADQHRQVMGELNKALGQQFNLASALSGAEDAYGDSQASMTDTLKQESTARFDAQREANDQQFALEKEAIEERAEARREGYDREHQDRKDAIAAEFRAATEANEALFRAEVLALEAEHELRRDAMDFDHRARKQALDDVFRTERHAMDRRLDLLDEEWDKRRRALDKEYDAQKKEAEFMIRTTWGGEREAWIARLAAIEEGHEAATREMERAQDDEANAIKDGQEDSETARKNGLDDQLSAEKDGLGLILAAEKTHLKDRHDAIAQALKDRFDLIAQAEKDRYDAAVKAGQDITEAEGKALDDRIRVAEKKLDDLQRLEDSKADARRSSQKTKHSLSLAELNTQLEETNRKHEEKLAGLGTIYGRAGRNLSTEMLTALSDLPPQIVAQLASAPQPAFDAFMANLQTTVAGTPQSTFDAAFAPFSEDIKGLLKQVGEFGGADMMTSVARGLANNPQGAQQLRDILAQLMAPKEVSPGVWAVPKAGGGFYPMKMTMADGGVVGREAMISSRPILWGEAGPEAYIPLGVSKRDRSTMLLDEVASIFGYGLVRMANGGITAGGSSGGTSFSTVNHVEVNVSVAAGVDPNAVGVAVRREVEKAFDHLGRQVAVRAWRN